MLRTFVNPDKFCPFCSSELERRGRTPFATIGGWMVLGNEFPHKNTAQMWLIVPRRHLSDPSELNGQDWRDIGGCFAVCRTDLGITDGGVMFRFGDPRFNVGSVEHLHLNVIEPICGKEYRPPFAKNMEEHAQDYQRLLGFRNELSKRADILSSGTWLFSKTGIETTQPAS